jgi:hypothetical protein
VLEKIYVRGSLKNRENGFELAVKNLVDTATLAGLGPVVVDEVSYPPEALSWVTERGEWRGDTLSYHTPAPFSFGAQARIVVQGQPLSPGEHSLTLTALVSEAGRVQFSVKDEVSGGEAG